MEATHHVLWYLKATLGYGILLCAYSAIHIHAYGDVDWVLVPLLVVLSQVF